MVETPKEQFIQMDDQEKNAHVLDAHSYNSIHEEDNNEDADDHRYILGLRVLKEDKVRLVGQVAQSGMARQGVIQEFTIVSRLLTSVEYQKSLSNDLCYTTGWLRGLSLGRKEEEIPAILTNTSNIDIEGDQAGPSVKDDGCGLTKLDSFRARSTETSTDAFLKTAV
nr:hypothetical protein [Tanacetum cinerariifolium]